MLVALGLLLAVGIPVAWWATRPSPSAGAPVLPVPAATTTPGDTATAPSGPAPSGPAPSGPAPAATRDASLVSGPRTAAPVRVRVPSLDVDAAVTPAGVTGAGVMAIPEDVREVGWYRFGPAPGAEEGSAVLAGHVDSAEQGEGALFELRKVETGARIVVELADGRQVGYRVTGRETITKRRLPVEQLFAREGPPRLVLVTCGGPFDEARSSYRDNLVVAAEPEPEP